MFAIFLHESMTTFYQIIFSFPTVIFTVPLFVCLIYWLIAIFGFVDIEILDIDMDGDIDSADSDAAQNGITGLLMKFGLNGVPLTIVLSLLSVIGWIVSYYIQYLGASYLPNLLIFSVALKIIALIISVFAAILITAQVIKPIRSIFKKLDATEVKHIIGQAMVVRSGEVTEKKGEALMEDGGADLLLNVRSSIGQSFVKGDIVVAIEHDELKNHYRVISKNEFDGLS